MINLSAVNISRCYFLDRKKLKKIVKFIFKSLGIFDANLSVIFVTDGEIERLNYLYRREKKATDVLAFSMREGISAYAKTSPFAIRGSGDRRLRNELSILGDVAISVDRARFQAKRFNSTFKKEIYLYIIHGILHLIGYNDEKPSARGRMQQKETQILNALWRRVN